MLNIKYVRFISKDTNDLLSDILSKSCTLYYHNKLLKEKNGFIIKHNFIYVKTVAGIRGVNINTHLADIFSGEQVDLVDHIPNLIIEKCDDNIHYIFKVGKKYIKVCNDNSIVLRRFRKWGTKFKLNHTKFIECEDCEYPNCLKTLFSSIF